MSSSATQRASLIASRPHWPVLGAFAAFLLSAILLLLVVWGLEQLRRQEREIEVRQLASAVAQDLGERLERALSASHALTAMLRQGGGVIDDFEPLAKELIGLFGGISALQLAPGGTISHVVPLAGNERVIGFSPLNDPVQGPEVQRVISSRKLGLTGPFELRQGGVGIVGRNPVFLTGRDGKEYFWGLVQVLIRIPELLVATRLNNLEEAGCRYELWRLPPGGATRHVFSRSSDEPLVGPVDIRIPVANGEWVLSVAPDRGWYSPGRLVLDGFVVLLLASIAALVTYFVLRQPQLLRQEVATRVRELQASEQKFHELVDSVGVILLKWDRQGNIVFINRFGEAFFGFAPGELDGRPLLGSIMPEMESDGRDLRQLVAQFLLEPEMHASSFNENICKNGQRLWVVWRNQAIRDAAGVVIGMFSVGLDPALWQSRHSTCRLRHDDPAAS